MKLIVNGTPVDITLENEKTVGDVLKSFEKEAAQNDATTVGINLNGEDINAGKFNLILQEPLEEDTVLSLNVVSRGSINESFKASSENFDALSKQMEEIPVLMQSGKEKDAHLIIAKLADEINCFCHVSTLSALFPETYTQIQIDGTDLGSFFKDFSSILSDFEQALEEKDTVTIGDICEYEISPRLAKLSQAVKNIVK
ncbi:MAG: hypothetical protein SO116_01850 [Treponema sp.]|nr:hypothetical protein [Spirochaetia bacterium]MDD7013988.1 hypothetical protein [Spirochaetales bacterium]MDY4901599.1 hypothetical protein [Treponema sp.]